MSRRSATEIIINLAGNMLEKARAYGNAIGELGQRNQRAMQMIQHSTAMGSNAIDNWGNRALIGSAALAIGFERTFVQTAAQFERYRISLNQLQGSEKEGAKALAWIEKFTQETPYAVNEVTNAFIRMKAFGLDPMDGTMQAIADQTAKMGGTAETLDGIALAFGQAWTKGKLQGDEINQMIERGVPVWEYLVKASKEHYNEGLGLTSETLSEMSSKGELAKGAILALIDEMGKASKGAAKAQMETWTGMVSNMGDHWTLFQKDVMDSGAFQELKNELDTMLSRLNEMKKTGEYDELVKTVGSDLVSAFEAAASAIKNVKEIGSEFGPILKTIGEGASALSESVGGYGNLAKILASIYAINKAARLAIPIAQGAWDIGKGAYDRVRGNRDNGPNDPPDNDYGPGVQPVFVTNMSALNGGDGGNRRRRNGPRPPPPPPRPPPPPTPLSFMQRIAEMGRRLMPALIPALMMSSRIIPVLGATMITYELGSLAYGAYKNYEANKTPVKKDDIQKAFESDFMSKSIADFNASLNSSTEINGRIQVDVNDERINVRSASIDHPGIHLSYANGLSMSD